MADEKRLAKQPMLYIVQPKGLKPAEVPMQTSFRSQRPSKAEEKEEQQPAEAPSNEREIRMRRQNSPHRQELAKLQKSEELEASGGEGEENPSAVSTEEKVEKDAPRDRRQRFHDMTLEEKVLYFFNLSPHVPKMKCEVTTEEENYRGYITDYVDGIVHMKVFQRPFQREVAFDSIKDIRLLGF